MIRDQKVTLGFVSQLFKIGLRMRSPFVGKELIKYAMDRESLKILVELDLDITNYCK